jgi:hypothetical protein
MSYENTSCPCGGRKKRETMICDPCKAFIASAPCNDLDFCEDHRNPVEKRRAMAILILAAARRRGKRLPLTFSA